MMYFRERRVDELLDAAGVVVFDMNGLLIDDELIQLKAVNAALSRFKWSIDEAYWIKNCVGRRAEEFISAFLQKNLGGRHIEVKKIVRAKEKAYEALLRESLPGILRKGAVDLVEELNHGRGKRRLALATSSTRRNVALLLELKTFSSKDIFDVIICGEDVTEAKPEPEIYLKVRDFFRKESKFLVFEDSASGVAAAKAAGMRCIAVPNNFTIGQDLTNADFVISDLSRDAKIIES